MAKKKSKRAKRAKRAKKPKRSRVNPIQPTQANSPAEPREDPFKVFMYHLVRLPWYFIKFWDWLFTLITALIVYLTK